MESLKPQAEDPPSSAKLSDRPSSHRRSRGAPDPMVSRVLPDRAEPERGAFRVGDMVWGKLKIRTWWPGKVVDPSSEIDSETKVLVSFFGDAEDVAWLEASKVIPFEEDLLRMLRQSTTARFVSAVKDALVETEYRLMSELFCRCSTNSILEFVGNCSISNYSPEQFCKRLLDAAKDASGVDMFEVVLLRCWGLALRRQIQCPTDLVETDYPPLDAPAAIDELQLEGKVNCSRVVKGPPIAEASNHKNKERSVAELIIAGTDPEVAQSLENMDKISPFHLSSTSQSSESPLPKMKGEKRRTFGVRNDTELDKPNSPRLSSEEQTKNDGILFEKERRSSGREHKRSKYLSPPYAVEIDVRRSLPMNNAVEKNPIKVTEGSESSSIKFICHVSKKEDDEILVVSNGNQSSMIAALTILRSVAVNPLSRKLFRSTVTHSDLFQKFRSSFCSGDANFQNELGRKEQQFAQATTEISTSKRNKKTSLASNEAPTIKGADATVPIEAGKIQKRRKMRHGETGSETTLANGTKRVGISQEKEMGESSANLQIDLNINAKDATDVRTPSIVTGIVACYPESISSQTKTSPVTKSPLPYVRKSLERMISKLTGFVPAESEVGSSDGLKPEMIDDLVADMDGLLKKVNRLLVGPPGNK
ncbi:hypothetical protein ZIOFF_052242 [Zingiber officinale]|uniref:PWWP domain-containing protein n=1 Tax=Zingiber officinale TaxID=94328 RepID=A0A8J5FU58_ZINOF|nr:hypothetical protein ZIOFF_052242 [Zingiber officinale]